MAGRLDPRSLVRAQLLGAEGGHVSQGVGKVVLVAIGGEQSFLGGAGVSHCPGVHGGQCLLGQALTLNEGLRDLQIHLGR